MIIIIEDGKPYYFPKIILKVKNCFFWGSLYGLLCCVLGPTVTLPILFIHTVVFPVGYMCSKKIRRSMHNLNFLNSPFIKYDKPEKYNVHGARNFYIHHESKVDNCTVKLGIWHLLPKSAYLRNKEELENVDNEVLSQLFEEELRKSDVPIILYLHGITRSRVFPHRIELYNIFQELDTHVIAFDYRGYGDSSNVTPSKDGVIEDTLVIYSWLRRLVGNHKSVFIWGHSLGSAITLHSMADLGRYTISSGLPEMALPRGIMLEGSFNNIYEALEEFPFATYFNWLPHFYLGMVRAIYTNRDVSFVPEEAVRSLTTTPILMLHARDDDIIMYSLGTKLYGHIVKSRKDYEQRPIFKSFPRGGHIFICKDERLPGIVGDFIKKYK